MTDSELNLAIHQEVEGYRWVACPGNDTCWDNGKGYAFSMGSVPNYCDNPVWCVRMMEEYKVNLNWSKCYRMDEWKWFAEHGEPGTESYIEVSDPSLTRAVALVVLQLTREGK